MKETLEQAALRLYPRLINDPYNPIEDDNKESRDIWIEGAKWQQEQDSWKRVIDETPPINIELLVKSPNGIVHLSSWRESYAIFSCQDKRESSLHWQWKTII
jgi:hypothetical protein